jgi:hypothetical protein
MNRGVWSRVFSWPERCFLPLQTFQDGVNPSVISSEIEIEIEIESGSESVSLTVVVIDEKPLLSRTVTENGIVNGTGSVLGGVRGAFELEAV